MATMLAKGILLLLAINTLLYIGGVRVVGNDNTSFMENWIDVNASTGNQVVVSETAKDKLPTTLEESGSGLLDFIDSLGAIKRFIFFVVNMVFTPLGLFMAAGMPQAITLIIGIPLMTVIMLGVAYFIRSGA